MTKLKQTGRKKTAAHDGAGSPDSRALRQASDIVMILDGNTVVEEISLSGTAKGLGPLDHWIGKPATDFLTVESVPKLERRLKTLAKKDENAVEILEINHIGKDDTEFPIRYSLHKGDKKQVILVGRDLRPTADVQQQLVKAQLALEREYEKHRDFETRYNVLRDNLGQALLIVDANGGRVLDANATATKLLDHAPNTLTGTSVNAVFQRPGRDPIIDLLIRCAGDPLADTIELSGIHAKQSLSVRPIMFRSGGETMILCRLDPIAHIVPATEDLLESLNALYEQTADAIVFTDARGVILHANDGFLSLCDIVRIADLDGATLADYLLRGIIDQRVLLENAASAGRVGMFATRLKSANGTEVAVEIGAAFLGEGSERAFGFVIRDRSRAEATAETAENTDATQNAMELVGTAPLKELVAATADVVEKLCIETAVKLTDNNRVAAAELLGLSRQSFYVRLRKYGMLKKDED